MHCYIYYATSMVYRWFLCEGFLGGHYFIVTPTHVWKSKELKPPRCKVMHICGRQHCTGCINQCTSVYSTVCRNGFCHLQKSQCTALACKTAIKPSSSVSECTALSVLNIANTLLHHTVHYGYCCAKFYASSNENCSSNVVSNRKKTSSVIKMIAFPVNWQLLQQR